MHRTRFMYRTRSLSPSRFHRRPLFRFTADHQSRVPNRGQMCRHPLTPHYSTLSCRMAKRCLWCPCPSQQHVQGPSPGSGERTGEPRRRSSRGEGGVGQATGFHLGDRDHQPRFGVQHGSCPRHCRGDLRCPPVWNMIIPACNPHRSRREPQPYRSPCGLSACLLAPCPYGTSKLKEASSKVTPICQHRWGWQPTKAPHNLKRRWLLRSSPHSSWCAM